MKVQAVAWRMVAHWIPHEHTGARDPVSGHFRGGRAGDTTSESFFENRVRPVLAGICLRCHGPQKQSGGLRLDSRDAMVKGGESGAAIDASNLDRSLLVLAIRRIDGVSAMPPDKALLPQQVADLKAWVSAGAPWPAHSARINAASHWAFQPIREVVPPAVKI